MKIWPFVIAAPVVAFFAVGAVRSQSPEGQERAAQRDAIATCWKDHGRKSMDAGSAQFVAGVCELAEKNYRDRWGVNP